MVLEGFVAEDPQKRLDDIKRKIANNKSLGIQQGTAELEQEAKKLQGQIVSRRQPVLVQSQASSPDLQSGDDFDDENENQTENQQPDEPQFGEDIDQKQSLKSSAEAAGQPQIAPTPAEIEAQEDEEAARPPVQQANATPGATSIDGVMPPTQQNESGQTGQPPKNKEQVAAPQPSEKKDNPLQNKIDQGKDVARDAIDKTAKQAIKQAAIAAWEAISAFVAANLYWLVPLAIILVIAMALVGYSIKIARSGAHGSDQVQPVNAASDKSALEKLVLLTGDKDLQTKLSGAFLTEAQTELTALLTGTTKAETKTAINDALTAAQNCAKTPPDTDACSSLPSKIKTVLVAVAQDISVVPQLSTQGHLPVDQSEVDKVAKYKSDYWTTNHPKDHGWILRNHNEVTYKGAGHGTYLHPGSGWFTAAGLPKDMWGDALDIAAGGATVYAPFDGTVIKSGGGGEHPILIQATNDPQTFAVLGNVSGRPSSGNVTAGQKLGTIKGHLHFELWVHNRPITCGTTFSKPRLWENIKKALKNL